MPDNDDSKRGIEPPNTHHRANAVRAAAKGVLGAIPVAGALLAEAADLTLPNPAERDRQRWEGDITDGVNSLHGRVDELDARAGNLAVTLSGASASIAKHMIEHCPDGLARDDITAADLQEALPDFTADEIIEGLADLESYGLLCATDFLNGDGYYTLTESSYRALDPPIMGWNPEEDARQVAALAVGTEYQDGVMANSLEQSLDWPRRRFNPAFRVILNLIDPSCVDDTMQPYYDAAGFYLSNADRARLRHFAGGSYP